LKGILSEEDIESYLSESEIKNDISEWDEWRYPISFESYTASIQDITFIEEIRKIVEEKKSKGYPIAIFLTGISDSRKIRSMGGKYNSNDELAWARAERVKKIILDNIKTIDPDEIITTSLGSDITSSEKTIILKEMKICTDGKNVAPDKDDFREVIVTVKSKMNVIEDKEYVSKIDEKDDKTSSDYITLLDAMFYSSYTVTTTGYGITPLDKWIKFFTAFENLFEFVIVNLVVGVVISVTNQQRE